MSTNNFSYDNILIVLPDFCIYSEGGEYLDYDNFSKDCYIKDIQHYISKIGFSPCDISDNNRYYPGSIIAEYNIEDSQYNKYKTIQVVIRSGYYSGENIDYIIEEGYTESKKTKTMDSKTDKKALQLEKILKKYGGEEYLKIAQFSNGEAIYQKKIQKN